MRWLVAVVLLASRTSRADDDEERITVRAPSRWDNPDVPQLHLDYDLPVNSEGPAPTRDRVTNIYALGPHARLVAEGEWWSSMQGPDLMGPHDLEDVARGWRAGFGLTYDLGPFQVGAHVAMGHVDSAHERGTYRTVGVSIFRTFRLSRWMRAWISLSAGIKQWFGERPPPSEANDASVMLSIGTTFR